MATHQAFRLVATIACQLQHARISSILLKPLLMLADQRQMRCILLTQ